jgi:hypothetical protein
LEVLRISSASPSFMLVLSRMKCVLSFLVPTSTFHRLHYLRRVVIYGGPESTETLLRAHGSKLTELYVSHATLRTKTLEFCPNLRRLSMPGVCSNTSCGLFSVLTRLARPSRGRFFQPPGTDYVAGGNCLRSLTLPQG